MKSPILAESSAVLYEDGNVVPVTIRIYQPVADPECEWTVDVSVVAGPHVYESQARYGDTLHVILEAFMRAAFAIKELGRHGTVSYRGRLDDYFFLDEILRWPKHGSRRRRWRRWERSG